MLKLHSNLEKKYNLSYFWFFFSKEKNTLLRYFTSSAVQKSLSDMQEIKFLGKCDILTSGFGFFWKCLIRNRTYKNPQLSCQATFSIICVYFCRCSTQQCNTRCWPTRVWRSWAAFSSSSPPSLSSGTNSSARNHQQVALILFYYLKLFQHSQRPHFFIFPKLKEKEVERKKGKSNVTVFL